MYLNCFGLTVNGIIRCLSKSYQDYLHVFFFALYRNCDLLRNHKIKRPNNIVKITHC